MKRFLPFLSMAILMAACGNNPQSPATETLGIQQAPAYNPDTIGLAQFQQWKAQNELANADEYNEPVLYAAQPQAKAKKTYTAPVRRASKPAPVASSPTSSETSSDHGVSETNGDGSMSSESSDVAKAPEKKGWSKAAKGAVIGGVAGAAGGAVVNKKNRVVGAVIGGVIGAGGGYVLGRKMDKKDGRIEMMP